MFQLIFWNHIFVTKLQAREPFDIIGGHEKWNKYKVSTNSMNSMIYKDEPNVGFVFILAMGT
jgi:hypothetical protein